MGIHDAAANQLGPELEASPRRARTSTEFLELKLEDGPVAEVGRTSEHVTVRFDWSVQQRHYLTVAEARALSQAIAAAAVAVEKDL